MRDLVGIGYWTGPESSGDLPWPGWLVGEPYETERCEGICRYLNGGSFFTGWLGYSWCRFGCGVPDKEMGSCDLTDGYWMWPQGLSHYVRRHHVRLPEEFIASMLRANWCAPVVSELPPFQRIPGGGLKIPVTHSFWIE